VGLFDDKHSIEPIFRIFLMALILFISFFIDNSIIIKLLDFSFYDKFFFLENFSILFTIICILIFTYSLNMFDGINLQSITYSIFVFLIFNFNSSLRLLSLVMIVCLCFLLILNYKNKIFLGDSGIYILAAIISYIIIHEYNINNIFFSIENIFIVMMIPGFEFIRLFIQRILKKKSPFIGDNKHLHHLLAKKFKLFNVYIIILILYVTPVIIRWLGVDSLLIIIFTLFIYMYLNFIVLKKFQ
jgi:UDP-N-acetylmuramyl pentapeptide phosphotransferase/UDP-N-acetylglucosamine-1-phosphate transferase